LKFQIQVKRKPTAEWTNFGPVWPERNPAMKVAQRLKEVLLRLKKVRQDLQDFGVPSAGESSLSEATAVRLIDESGKQIWDAVISD
jgi:hypothetical protein